MSRLTSSAARDRRIYAVVSGIPRGRVTSYGHVADLAGLGRGARQVGRALSQLPPTTDVPWHRVIRSGGQLAFPAGSDSYERQRQRLADEGVEVVGAGRVSLKRFGWQRSLDELLWKPD